MELGCGLEQAKEKRTIFSDSHAAYYHTCTIFHLSRLYFITGCADLGVENINILMEIGSDHHIMIVIDA